MNVPMIHYNYLTSPSYAHKHVTILSLIKDLPKFFVVRLAFAEKENA